MIGKSLNSLPPVLQVLGTTIVSSQGDTHYDMFLSDGENGILSTSSVQLNPIHSSGKLSVFTVVKIDDFNNGKKCDGSGYNFRILSLKIIANGLEVCKLIGNPASLDPEMKVYLNYFTTKLEMRAMLKIEVDRFKKKCLNTSSNIGKLSTGCLEKICSGEIIIGPILQVITLVKVTNAEENTFNYSVQLSDGKFSFNRFYTRSLHFNNLVAAGLISEFSIIRLDQYEQTTCKSRIKIKNITVINKGSDVKSKIDNPTPVKDGASVRFAITDRMLNKLLSYNDLSKSELDTSCLSDMQHEIAVSKPILQLITPHRYGGQCNLEISDGLFKIYTEMLNKELTEKINSGAFMEHNIIQVDEYEVSIAKQVYDEFM